MHVPRQCEAFFRFYWMAKRNGDGLSVKVRAAVIRSIVAPCRFEKPTNRLPPVCRSTHRHSVWPKQAGGKSPEQSLPKKPDCNSRGQTCQTEPRVRKGGILRSRDAARRVSTNGHNLILWAWPVGRARFSSPSSLASPRFRLARHVTSFPSKGRAS